MKSDASGPAIDVRGLTVRFGDVVAVSGLDLDVRRGEVLGFLGPNGAGKTTTIRTLLDLLRPQEGRVEILGLDVREAGGELRRRLGYLPGDLELFPFMTGAATLDFFCNLFGGASPLRDEVIDRLGFPRSALGRKLRTYSTGMRQMLGIAVAMQHDPEVLILDEPTTGLDPVVRSAFLAIVRDRAAAGRTVMLSSHVLAEVEDCADRVALIHGGRLHLLEEIAELRGRLPRRVKLRYADGRESSFPHQGPPGKFLRDLDLEDLVDIEVRPADLRDVFRAMVDGEVAP